MSSYHHDLDIRIEGERYAAIVIKGNKILMVHRIKNGYEYYVFPGGHRQKIETGEQAVCREVYEETGIEVVNQKMVLSFSHENHIEKNFYYICEWKKGEKPLLTGEEIDADPKTDFFDPMWIDISRINELNILPKVAKDWLLKNTHLTLSD